MRALVTWAGLGGKFCPFVVLRGALYGRQKTRLGKEPKSRDRVQFTKVNEHGYHVISDVHTERDVHQE